MSAPREKYFAFDVVSSSVNIADPLALISTGDF